ncbi:hypothetical protein AgCh_023861 [Apium graveolens]
MSDEDKLFNLLAGLKPWAQAELSGKNHKGEDRTKKNDRKNGNGDARDYGSLKVLVTRENEENNEGNDGVQVRVNPMRLVALRTEKSVEGDGLMYVKALVNGKTVMTMVDTGATNSFIGLDCVAELGLKLKPSSNQIKMANSEVQKIGGMDFFRMTSRAIMLRYGGGIMIMDEACPCFVKAVPMQIDKG